MMFLLNFVKRCFKNRTLAIHLSFRRREGGWHLPFFLNVNVLTSVSICSGAVCSLSSVFRLVVVRDSCNFESERGEEKEKKKMGIVLLAI